MLVLNNIKLTEKEEEALKHRLAVPDAISEYFEDCEELLSAADIDAVPDICKLLEDNKYNEAVEKNALVTTLVLIDCVEGSTWLAQFGRKQYISSNSIAVIHRLAKKVEQACKLDPGSITLPTEAR